MEILITGGTGAFGNALTARMIEDKRWHRICIYSRDEHKQDQMRQRFEDNKKLRFFLGDVRDKDRLRLALQGIDAVVHTAALKIVPTAEYNPMEYIKTNVVGAQNLIDCLSEREVYTKVIALSTDKACNPINLYGATKLCAEKLFLAANNIGGFHGPRYAVIRYGNVSNSTSSVIPHFFDLVRQDKKITITHVDMTRFWITLDEAVEHTTNALDYMCGGEVFVPRMPAFRVVDLGKAVYGICESSRDVESLESFDVTGVRPGEKLHEVVITLEELQDCRFSDKLGMYIIHPYPKAPYEARAISDMDKWSAISSQGVYVKQLRQDELSERIRSCCSL